MRLTLVVLGSIQIAQVVVHVLAAASQSAWSAQRIGAALDDDIVRLTAALCALSVAGLLNRRAAGRHP